MSILYILFGCLTVSLIVAFIIISSLEKKYKEDKLFYTNTCVIKPVNDIEVLDEEVTNKEDVPEIISHYSLRDDNEEII